MKLPYPLLPTPHPLLLAITLVFLFFVQCKEDEFTSIDSQKEELLDNFLEQYLNDNPMYDLYESNELTVQEAEMVIRELNQGNELLNILPKYISDPVKVKDVTEFCLQSANLAQQLRQYNYTKEEVKKRIVDYPIRSSQKENVQPQISIRSFYGEPDPCLDKCHKRYDLCKKHAGQDGAATYTNVVIASFGFALYTDGGSILFAGFVAGPIAGFITYANGRNQCRDIVRLCEEECESARVDEIIK